LKAKVPIGKTILDRLIFKRFDLSRFFRWILVLILYFITFSTLDQLTQRLQLFPGVVAWYPPDGISVAFLLTFGIGFTPAFTLASLISSLFIYRLATPLAPILVWAVILSIVYGIIAFLLRNRVRITLSLQNLRDILLLILFSAIGSTVLALISILNLVNYGQVPSSQFFITLLQWWIGEMIGVLVFTPFLLIHVMPWLKRFIDGEWANLKPRKFHHRPSLQSIGQVISIPVVLYLVFGIPALRSIQPLYLIAAPLIWIALSNGFSSVSLAIVVMNFGTVLAIWLFKFDISRLGELQFLMFGVYASTLLTGAIVTKQKKTEEELRHQEVRNRSLIENAPDAITLVGADRLIKYLSPSTQRILGYTPEEQVGSNPAELTHPDDLPSLMVLLDDLVQKPGKVIATQYRFRHKDGSWRWLESTITNLLTEPSVQAIVFNFRDITERKQGDETLQKSEKRFRALVEHSLEEISLVDSDGNLTYESPTTRRPLGYPPNSLVGHNLFDLFHPDERAAAAQLLEQTIKDPGSVHEALFRLRHQDGSWRWMEGLLTNLLDEPAVQSVVINYRDITERKMAEQEIASLAKFPSENPNMVLRFSREGTILYANPVSGPLLDMWGCAVGGPAPQFWRDLTAQLLSSRENKTVDIECDGKIYEMIVIPVIEPDYVNLYGRDITKRKKAEDEIKINNEELSMLFELSHSLAVADNLEDVLNIVNRHAVESIHTTFSRIALLEDEKFIMRAAYPIRVLSRDLGIGFQVPLSALPYTQHVLEQNEPTILQAVDPQIGNEEKKALLLDFAQSLCLIPLRSSDSSHSSVNLLGVLMLGEARNEKREPFTPGKIRLAQSIGDSAAIAIQRILLGEQISHRLQQSIALTEIDLAIMTTSDMVVSLDILLMHLTVQLKVDAADVWYYNPSSQSLEFVTSRGFQSPEFKSGKPIRIGEGYAGRSALERQTIYVPNLTMLSDNPRLAKAMMVEPFISYYAVPLIVKDQIKGVIELFHRTELESSEEWLKFLNSLANQAAIAIDNSSLFNDLQQSNTELTQAYDATIQGWSRALDLRDKETEGHTQRVTELTMKLGSLFGLSETDLVHVRRGALLHDIGKMGVPDRILLKPGPLTDEEWIIMKKHPTFAYEMLSPIHYLQPALNIPYGHHEKWDGSGYPRGLSGDQIPIAARIFALVDVWDALTSDRPYRAAWPDDKVLNHIRSLTGTHFDPQVVKVCLESGLLASRKKL